MAFVRTVKTKTSTGELHEYVRIVESYFENGKRKQKVIANLGNLAFLRKDIKQIVNGLLRVAGEKSFVFKEDLRNETVKEYGTTYVVDKLWNFLELDGAIAQFLEAKKTELSYGKWIKMMVHNKLSDPSSKLGIFEWLKGVFFEDHEFDEKVFDESLEIENQIQKKEAMKFYRALDYLLKMKKELEKHLYLKLQDLFSLKVDLVFYDVTSSYFEGEGPKGLAKKGYSRDKKPGKNQVVIGLIMCNGFPIGHEVFEGNRVDKKTVKEVLSKLKEEFEIDQLIFVGDRGLITKENLEELERNGFESILALHKRRNREVKKILKKRPSTYLKVNEELQLREVKEKNLRYIICLNPKVAAEQKKDREEDLTCLKEQLEQLGKKVASKKRFQIKRIIRQAEEILSHRHGRRFFDYKLDEKEGKLSYWLKEEALLLEQELDGVYILRTYEKDLTALKVVEAYKDLADVERAFRTMKSVIDLRPFFHRKETRVRAHVFICVLAYLLEKVIEKALKKAKVELSAEKALMSLKQMAVAFMKVDNESYGYVSEPSHRQRQIFRALNLKLPPRILVPKKP